MTQSTTDASSVLEINRPGAHVGAEGVRYCIWAPLHAGLQVRVRRGADGRSVLLRLERQENGYFEVSDREG
ncbi:MAG: hypothetical protein ABIV50_09095, partial [Opitutus sp.]